MTVPYTFANTPGGQTIPLSQLDENFSYLETYVKQPGPTGPIGVMGPTGPTGPIGPTGPQTAANLYQLNDVNVTEGLAINNQYLQWNNPTSKWIANKPTQIQFNSVTATGAFSIDRSTSEIFVVSLTGNVTSFAITGWPASGTWARVVLEINNTGSFNINAWPTGTIWALGRVPTITSGAGKKDVIVLMTFNGGTTIFANIVGQNYS